MRHSRRTKAANKNSPTKAALKGEVRIIGGSLRGRKLQFNTVDGLRPSLDRIRETAFNWLTMDIAGRCCLDLFSGSGALGFEAVSRGAAHVVMVEKDKMVSADLQGNRDKLALDNIDIINQDANDFLQNNHTKFDLVFLDPPFEQGLLEPTLALLAQHLSTDALVYIEQEAASSAFTPDEKTWRQLKYKQTSRFSYALYQYQPSDGQ